MNAFVDLIKECGSAQYDFLLRETQTYEIIEDVSRRKSEIGILYLNSFNEAVIRNIMKANDLKFTELFVAEPHVFISDKHPLAERRSVSLEELGTYLYLSFEQGEHNSFYYSEEIFSTQVRAKNICVRDRAITELVEKQKKQWLFGRENVDSYYLEFDDERSGGFEPLKYIIDDKKVVLGLITTKSPELENKEEVIARIHAATEYIPLDRLYLSPQCGFASCEIGNRLTEEEQWAKLALVKEIADEVWG